VHYNFATDQTAHRTQSCAGILRGLQMDMRSDGLKDVAANGACESASGNFKAIPSRRVDLPINLSLWLLESKAILDEL